MRIGVLIPDRNDRNDFLNHCLFMMRNQTVKPDIIEVVNFETNLKTDLTLRYKVGIKALKEKGADVIFFIENDDWYSKKYIETMLTKWIENGKPLLFGINNTVYYHIFRRTYKEMKHPNRASMMSTMISSELEIHYPNDSEVFLDLYLWNNYKGISATFEDTICLGIKHGIGVCGGNGHNDNFHYNNIDSNLSYLFKKVDSDSFNFYLKCIESK